MEDEVKSTEHYRKLALKTSYQNWLRQNKLQDTPETWERFVESRKFLHGQRRPVMRADGKGYK